MRSAHASQGGVLVRDEVGPFSCWSSKKDGAVRACRATEYTEQNTLGSGKRNDEADVSEVT